MTEDGRHFEKMREVARLATLVADRILEAQVTDRPLPKDQFKALVGAARLLEEHGFPWPPLVEQVLDEAGKRFSEADTAPDAADPKPESESVVAGLTRFLGAFKRP